MAGVAVNRLVFVDETGANTAMTRTYGRAPAGQRVEGLKCSPLTGRENAFRELAS
jgi:hypothetical protein